jgi:S1-C subfamily serine protease
MNHGWSGRQFGAVLLAALALSVAAVPALAASEDEQARKDLERARQEVEKARTELQKATRELARSMAKVERDNPKAQYFEYMTDPKRAVLGVLIPDDIENGESRGVRLLAVTPGSGAEKGGLKAGDLVTALDGTSLAAEGKRSPQKRMKEFMRTLKAGDEVKVDYERDGKGRSTTVETQPPEPEMAMAPLPMIQEWLHDEDFDKSDPMAMMPWLHFRGPAIRGLELARLDEDLGSYFKTRDGVLVVKAPRSGALNLKSGDVIQKIDGDSVSEPVTVLDKLRSRGEEQTVKLEIVRKGRKMELQGQIPVADARGMRPPRPPRAVPPVPPVPPAAPEPEDDGT